MFARKVTVFACSAVALGLLGASPTGCASDMYVGAEEADAAPPPPPVFEAPDAGTSTGDTPARTLTEYCPSSTCPEGWTTCLGSRFACDVDLNSDAKNCGACGAACPAGTPFEDFACVGGVCVMQCKRDYADCDGIADNGCEAYLTTNDHCGSCANTCTDDAPCNRQPPSNLKVDCGCDAPYTSCKPAGTAPASCVDLSVADTTCGACGTVCNRAGGPGAPPAPPNSYYGCNNGQCGSLKCNSGFADCNNDLGAPDSDGCEARLGTHAQCTQCGDDCRARDMNCVYDTFMGASCGCAPGQNFCGYSLTDPFYGKCADLSSDEKNCGACNHSCPGTTTRSKGVCEYGECKLECFGRWADCNGKVSDDCEVDTFSDPQNCGGCGIACDVAAGQACAGGRCVVEPCSEGEVPQ